MTITLSRVIVHPTKMIVVPPRHYCVVSNPVLRNEEGVVLLDPFGQAKLEHAELEVGVWFSVSV